MFDNGDFLLIGMLTKKIKSILTGIKSWRSEERGSTVDLIATTNDGKDVRLSFAKPKDGKDGEDGDKGDDGVSVTNIRINNQGHLIATLSDGKNIDAGSIGSSAVFTQDLTATTNIGSVKAGTKYAKDTPLEKALRDILINIEPPTVTFNITPGTLLYDKVNDTLSSLRFDVTAVKKTNPVAKVEVFIDNRLVHTANTLTFTYNHTFAPATNADSIALKVVVTDDANLTGQATKTIKFVGKSYYGFVDEGITAPNEAQVKGLQSNTLKDVRALNYDNIVMTYNKVVYAYPKSFGALTDIRDVKNNVPYMDSFARTEVRVDGIDYYCYTLKDASGTRGTDLTFS